jgi:hypothetical protein
MSNVFRRFPEPGGDYDAGANYNQYQLESTLGLITSQLYNDGGDLTLKVGQIGIDNGPNKGVAKIDTEEVIDLSGCSNSNWIKVEMAISGTAPVFTATDITGATDPSEAPTTFKNSYDGEKGGFYISASKRCIGLAWKNGSDVLLAIINVCPHINNYWASEIGLHTDTIHRQRAPKMGFNFEIGDWNMDIAVGAIIPEYFDVFEEAVINVKTIIRNDANTSFLPLEILVSAAAGTPPSGGCSGVSGGNIGLGRVQNQGFDNANYDSTSYNRGWITIYMKDF